jgi:hypothetical protein
MASGWCSWDRSGWRVTRGGRGSFLDFVRKQDAATAAVASIEDAAECGERADALVSGVLGQVMRQHRGGAGLREGAVAGTRANCWELAEEAGHEGPHRMQALLRRYRWSWKKLRDARCWNPSATGRPRVDYPPSETEMMHGGEPVLVPGENAGPRARTAFAAVLQTGAYVAAPIMPQRTGDRLSARRSRRYRARASARPRPRLRQLVIRPRSG